MVLIYHRSDFGKVPQEERVMEALRPFDIPFGEYVIPHAGDPAKMKSPEFIAKVEKGPVAFLTVLPDGMPSMGKNLTLWFLYCIAVGVFAAYLTGRVLPPGAASAENFRFASCTAFIGYALALWQNSIWYKRAWTTTLKQNLDGLIYGLATGGVFVWLWTS